MGSNRIKYGIDLGTTNSAIVQTVRGKGHIVKSDMQRDTTPSAVAYGRKGRLRVGLLAYNQLKSDRLQALKRDRDIRNVFVEFKRTMGSDHYYVPSVVPSLHRSSEKLSSEVLKELRRYVTDDNVSAAVVTIPAAFKVKQQQATLRAAEMAGISQCVLLQEPVAAAMAYGLTAENRDGRWLVFDFGGGTFDTALVTIQKGQITVKDTEGDHFLGGKDLDYAVVNEIFFEEIEEVLDIDEYLTGDPQRKEYLRDALKHWAEEARIALSFHKSHFVESDLDEIILADGEDLTLDFQITQERLRSVIEPIYQKAINKSLALLSRNKLKGKDIDNLILVGGPTYSPVLKQMLTEQIRQPDTSIDPMTVVARGAALYASTIEQNVKVEDNAEPLKLDKLQLDVHYPSTTIDSMEMVNIKYFNADVFDSGPLEIELRRTGTGWSSGRHPIDLHGSLIKVMLEDGKVNVFDIEVTDASGDIIATNPTEITIIQGTKLSAPPLPNSLGVEIETDTGDRFFAELQGAEKNKTLPVTGIKKNLMTPNIIRPGVSSDRLLIRIYEGSEQASGKKRTIWCHHVMTCELTGDNVDQLIPEHSVFDLLVKTKETSSIFSRVSLLFELLDDELNPEPIDDKTEWINDEIQWARSHIDELLELVTVDKALITQIKKRLYQSEARLKVAKKLKEPGKIEKAVSDLQGSLCLVGEI